MPVRKRGRKPPPDAERCTAKNAAGKRCAKRRVKALETCAQHAEGADRGGAPPKLTDDVADAIITVLALGGIVGDAAVAAGVARSTVFAWLDRGDPDGTDPADAPYRAFRERVDRTVAEVKQNVVASIVKAAQTDWRAGAFYLRNVDPENWGAAAPRTTEPAASKPKPGEPPQLRVVDDLVGPDGKAL